MAQRAVAHTPPEESVTAADRQPARVAWAQSRHFARGRTVHPALTREALEWGLTALFGTETSQEAWSSILQPNDVIGIKFDPVGRQELCDSAVLGAALVESLVDAGWKKTQIVLIDAPAGLAERLGTQPAFTGFEPAATDFGTVTDQVSSALEQVSAIISMAGLKQDAALGIRAAVTNLTTGWVRHPTRIELIEDGEGVASLLAHPLIRPRIRLCVVDAVRVMIDGGPLAYSARIRDPGVLLLSTDPVALDRVGLGLIDDLRVGEGLKAISAEPTGVPMLKTAHRRGAGVAVLREIDVLKREF